MEFVSTILKSVGSLLVGLLPVARQRLAERAAGKEPESAAHSVSDDLLDAAIARLGALQPDDPIWKRCVVGLEASIVRPELFAKPSIREWISRKKVREGLKAAVEAKFGRGSVPTDLARQLADEYADATGEDRRLADHPIRIALAYLQASVQGSVRDPGTAVIVQASASELNRRLDEGLANLAESAGLTRNAYVSQRFTQEARNDLGKILCRRATAGQQTAIDLRCLISEFEDGCRLAAAERAIQQEIHYWLARVEAGAGNADKADRLLKDLVRQGFNVPEYVWALVELARNQPEQALRRIRSETDPESRTAIFHILLKTEGATAALRFVESIGSIEPTTFSAVGLNNICVTMMAEGRTADASAILARLPPEVLSKCTHLYYMYAVCLLLPMLPPDRQSSLMSAGFAAVVEHSLDSPESDQARANALDAVLKAYQCALDSEDHVLAERCANGVRGLRLLDPSSRDEEISAIQEAMKDGETAARLIWVVRAYNIAFDKAPLENYLAHAQRLGGLNEEQLRAKLYLLNHPDRSRELARFLDEEWANLLSDNNPEALVIMRVQALANMGDVDGATAFLDANLVYVSDAVASRLQLMLRDARGEDLSDPAIALYKASNEIEDLLNLVQILQGRKQWKRLAPYSAELFLREPNFDTAMLRLKCLQKTRASAKDVSEFLDGTVSRVQQRPVIRSARAWAKFEAGDHLTAKRLNDELLSERNEVTDIALDVNIAIRTGDWERFPIVAAKAWERRSQLSGQMLLTLGKLVGFSDPMQALALAQEAVAREGDDPKILVEANAVAIAARRDDLAIPWVHKAADLSKDGGPVSVFSHRELIEFMRSKADSWKKKNDMYRTAQVPLHLAASMFNVPLSQLLIGIPRQNSEEADARRRNPVPIRSGSRLPIVSSEFSRIAVDITSLFILSELGRLDEVLNLYEEVFISPRIMEVLLEDRAKVAFHQPSRIAEVKPLTALLAAGRLQVIHSKGEDVIFREVGDEGASLLAAASARGGRYVHPGPLFKVASFMEDEAEVGHLAPLLADTVDVANALRAEGIITQAVCDESVASLKQTGTADRLPIAATTPLFLDGLAVQYLQQVKLLQPLLNSGHEVSIHKSTVDEWQALLATESMTAKLSEAIDAIRLPLKAGLMSGKVKFLTQSRRQSDRLNATTLLPVIDLLENTEQFDAAVVDDRVLGSNAFTSDSKGRSVPVISSLDLLDGLVRDGILSVESRRETLHLLRARCFFCIPIDPVDLQVYLYEAAVENGKVRESAELRVIREYLSRLNSTDVLCTTSDLAYQDSLWRTGNLVIGRLWIDSCVAIIDAAAKSDWIVSNVIPDPELAMRFAENGEARIAQVVASQLGVSLFAPTSDRARRDAYVRWLENSRLATLLPANANVLDIAAGQAAELLLQRTQEVAIELRSRNRPHTTE